MVIADLFTGAQTPAHVTTVEFARPRPPRSPRPGFRRQHGRRAAARARPGPGRDRARRVPARLPDRGPGVLRGRRFGNLVLAASRRQLPLGALAGRAAGDPFPGRVLGGADLGRFAAGATPLRDGEAGPAPAPPLDLFDVRGCTGLPDPG